MSETPPPMPLSPGAQMSCAEVRPYLSAYVDGELAEPLRAQIARHLAGCAECAARAASYHATDALLASLPATTPAPEVFHAVMAAAREQNAEPVERETLASPLAGLAARRLRVVRPEPRQQDTPAVFGAHRKSWVATVAPAVAAVLLVSLAALAFRGLVMAPHTSPAATPTTVGTILDRTHAQVAAVANTVHLPFEPVFPTYVPNEVSGVDVSLGYASDNKTVIYLDITWMAPSIANLQAIRIREIRAGYDYPGYTSDTSDGAVSWKLIPEQVWEPLKSDGHGRITGTVVDSKSVAAGEQRGNELSIAVEAVGPPLANVESLRATLRHVTLSLDGPDKPIPLASHPTKGLVLHYKAQSQVTAGETPAWSAEVYIDPAADAQYVAVSANETVRYVDVSRGLQGYRLDPQTNTYAIGSRSQFSGEMNPEKNGNQNVTHIFSDAYTLLQSGLLWYSGPAKLGETSVYDYILVSAPNKTHVYIDPQTKQVVQMMVERNVVWNVPGDTNQVFGGAGCSYFTLIEYVQPDDVPAGTFSPTPPSNSHQDQSHIPATLTCS
ncbi:MAG TPA: zf-HC2 domain-containing protein [Ktedonobacterales bacterium]